MMRSLSLLVLALLLVGCQKGTQDLREWTSEVRDREPDPIEPIPPIRTPEVVAYEAMELRDPFNRAGREREEEER